MMKLLRRLYIKEPSIYDVHTEEVKLGGRMWMGKGFSSLWMPTK